MALVGNFDDKLTMKFHRAADLPPRLPGTEGFHTVVLLNEHGPAMRISLPNGILFAGRRAPADLILFGATVSRRHCQFGRRGNDTLLSDLNAMNGTSVDNARIATPTVL